MSDAMTPEHLQSLLELLKTVKVFEDLAREDLEWFIAQCEERRAEPGEITTKEDNPADFMIVMLEGEVHARREALGGGGPTFTAQAGNVTGVLPFSRMKNAGVTARAVTPVLALYFPVGKFPQLFERMPELTRRLVGLLTDRVREVTRTEQQREKLAALGKLSAGLAHELNNPSAAARRSASALRDCLQRLREAYKNLPSGPMDFSVIFRTEEEVRSNLAPAENPDEFARMDREEAIQGWLENHKVSDAWRVAPLLADANLTNQDLEKLAVAAGPVLSVELVRFGTILEIERIAQELDHSIARVSDLIKAIKEYSYMDQAPLQEVDIKSSLETTLTIMNHKLKRNVAVTRDYAKDLPKVMAYGSELNQVWTNLIDNAADAMKENGKLLIRTRLENDCILVEIVDNGSGIPAEIQSRIFEPFFTTKDVGQGTGLGLDVVQRIIVRKMRGTVQLRSVPGDTSFQVRIPIQSKL